MNWLDSDAVSVARLLVLLLAPVLVFGPLRWAAIAWLAMSHLDATGPDMASNLGIGWVNAVKTLGAPLILVFRTWHVDGVLQSTVPMRLWAALTTYAAIATLWSDFELAGWKIAGNMAGILLSFLAAERLVAGGYLDSRSLKAFIVVSLGIAAFQTALFGGGQYGFDGPDQNVRLTGFTGAQAFAAVVVALLAAILWAPSMTGPARFAWSAVLIGALVLNGSRTWSFGALAVLAIYFLSSLRRALTSLPVAAAGLTLGLLIAALLTGFDLREGPASDNRLVTSLTAVASGEDTAGRAASRNITYRLMLYTGVIDEMAQASALQVLFGHGSSMGGRITLQVFPQFYTRSLMDPNRTIHNEWLRVLYEWGILGLILWTLAFAGVCAGAVEAARRDQPFNGSLLAFLPAITLALCAENLLAGAGSPIVVGFVMLVALSLSSPRQGELHAV